MMSRQLLLAALCCVTWCVASAQPFSGTIFIDPDIITDADQTTHQQVVAAGQGSRVMFDRRVNDWITVNAILFDATFSDGLSFEIQVNPEFSSAEASAQAARFAPIIGRLPTALRADVQTIWIHKGTQPFGGGNNNLLIHTGQADLYANDGILEETFVHEASHTSLDAAHAGAPGWLVAQSSDPNFISTYARDNPTREDVAETFLTYLAVQYRADRISQQLYDTIVQTIPNRLAYFQSLSLDMFPIVTSADKLPASATDVVTELRHFPNPIDGNAQFVLALSRPGDVRIVVTDILGRQLSTINAGTLSSGTHEIPFDVSGFAAGVYFYRVEAGGDVKTSRAVRRR